MWFLITLALLALAETDSLAHSPPELETWQVDGVSMNPVLPHGSLVRVDRAYYRARKVKRGDLLLFRHSLFKIPIFKKVHAVPGDRFSIRRQESCKGYQVLIRGTVERNSQGIAYCLKRPNERPLKYYADSSGGRVPADQYLVFGEDPDGGGVDSTRFGFLRRGAILGKVVAVRRAAPGL